MHRRVGGPVFSVRITEPTRERARGLAEPLHPAPGRVVQFHPVINGVRAAVHFSYERFGSQPHA